MQSGTDRRSNALLVAGVLAGPFFFLVTTIQDLTRSGFDSLRCQVSHLAIGDSGWVQAINFIVTGALIMVFALGLFRALRPQKLVAAFLGLMGVGLITATFFATVPGFGCPSGPLTVPPVVTINGPVHDSAAGLMFLGFAVAAILCGRRAFQEGWHAFGVYSIVSVVAMLGFLSVSSIGYAQAPNPLEVSGLFERLALLSVFAWATTFAASLLRVQQSTSASGK